MESDGIGFFGVAALLAIYFLPAFIASGRNHKNISSITALNILLGWTVLGWVASLVWSLTDNTG